MRLLALLCLAFLLAAGMVQGSPIVRSPGGGAGRQVPASRDVCWSLPCDLEAGKITSEIISEFGIDSECAKDFAISFDATLTAAIGYGGYFSWAPGDPPVTSFNWRFYGDAGCVPDALLDTFAGLGTETFIGYDGYGYPTYRYEQDLSFEVTGGARYWFVLQAADHPYPPQWGRMWTMLNITECDGMFRSEYFGYPDWVPAGDLMDPAQFPQEFECGEQVPVKAATWGKVRGLYR